MSKSARTRVNSDIREQCPGGAELLDAMELAHQMASRHGVGSPADVLLEKMRLARDAMADHVLRQNKSPAEAGDCLGSRGIRTKVSIPAPRGGDTTNQPRL